MIAAANFRLVNGRHFGTLDLLGGIDAGRYSGGKRRFYCPIHGSDRQKSLVFDDAGELAGVGYCHSCHATVIIEDWPGKAPRQPGKALSTAQRLVQPLPVKQKSAPAPDGDLATLRSKDDVMQSLISRDKAQAYLAARGIEPHILPIAEMGYIPENAILKNLRSKWLDRLMFPLWSPDGIGYAGRALWGWQQGMDEDAHKTLLDAYSDTCEQQHKPNDRRRWEKTNIAGWYGPAPEALAETVIIVEGALDRLALLCAGAESGDVLAAVGTAFQHEWLPRHVRYAVLVFDSDAPGQERAKAKAREIHLAGIDVAIAAPAADGLGKDPSARYRLAGFAGLGYIWQAYDRVHGVIERPPAPAPHIEPPAVVIETPPAPAIEPSHAPIVFPPIKISDPPPYLDKGHMRELFSACPWYDASAPDNAASQAALWICANELPKEPGVTSAMSDMMAVYGLLLRVFASGAPVGMTPAIEGWLKLEDKQKAPRQLGLAPFVHLLRQAYRWHSSELAQACVDAALSGDVVSAPTGGTYRQRVERLQAQGVGYRAACEAVKQEYIASRTRA